MSSSGRIRLSVIEKALDECLPGCRWAEGKHRWHIYPPAGPCFYLPQGGHGRGMRAEIERGHVRKMGRQFLILECLEDKIPGL